MPTPDTWGSPLSRLTGALRDYGGEPSAKLGLDSCQAGTVRFDDCFVPEERVLGGEEPEELSSRTP